ncbi:cytochrome-c peroxidase [Pseudoxanthomonas indica]|uniref:Cytochrome c peroxidase n=1 Tax=Pseudoxanthomonas indica TaxID=428993 RepID=A0A1T5J4R3_9GAMM|nr:cytochrome-c peroxidase [Pseudoxanthomonas indica]GGD56274.1 cytochrome c551 peroxidase [Pseudoxanthomonas indica]SKC46188.1 cytochrome c peroxidase [Pseudoxanthomonas indica]
MKPTRSFTITCLVIATLGSGLTACKKSESVDAPAAMPTADAAQIAAPAADPLRDSARQLFQPLPDKLDKVRDQPLTEARIALGQSLFFDPRLSGSHTISCNSCHNLGTAGADNVVTSTGHGGQKGPRNSPTVLNSVFNLAQFWDGRAPDLKEQAKGPVQNPVEMHNTIERVEETLDSMPGYVEAFAAAFPGETDPINFENMARAIEAFEATLITPSSRFDQFLTGKADLNAQEREGLSLFIDKGCVACHSGANVGGQAYFAFGAVKRPDEAILPPADLGRAAVTKEAGDAFVFRAAPLRNVARTAPYFHSGQVWDLNEAIRVMAESQLGQNLSATEIEAIAAFLRSLDGREPAITPPVLPTSTTATPRPL